MEKLIRNRINNLNLEIKEMSEAQSTLKAFTSGAAFSNNEKIKENEIRISELELVLKIMASNAS